MKKGVGKVDANSVYRVLETQENYVRNLYREKLRKKVKTTASQEMRYLLDLGIQMHREGRREKFEMSHYFRAELRTFTENFFKENNANYISRLVEISRYLRFMLLLMLEAIEMLYKIYWMMKDQTPFPDEYDGNRKNGYFLSVEKVAQTDCNAKLRNIRDEIGADAEMIKNRIEADKGKAF